MNIETLLTSSLTATLVTVFWESVLKPRRARRNVAAAVAAEISLNVTSIAGKLAATAEHSGQVPPNFSLSTQVFKALASRIGELPPAIMTDIVALYYQFDELNKTPELYRTYEYDLQYADPVTSSTARYEMTQLHGNFLEFLRSVIPECYGILDQLGTVGAPGWTRRRLPQLKELLMDRSTEGLAENLE